MRTRKNIYVIIFVCACNLFLLFKNMYIHQHLYIEFIINLQNFLLSEIKVEIYYKRETKIFLSKQSFALI